MQYCWIVPLNSVLYDTFIRIFKYCLKYIPADISVLSEIFTGIFQTLLNSKILCSQILPLQRTLWIHCSFHTVWWTVFVSLFKNVIKNKIISFHKDYFASAVSFFPLKYICISANITCDFLKTELNGFKFPNTGNIFSLFI